MTRAHTLLIAFMGIAGCVEPPLESTVQHAAVRQLAVPDSSFRLSQADRQLVAVFFDADALERFLAHVPATERAGYLRQFTFSTDPNQRTVSYLRRVNDPKLDAILQKVWLPFNQLMGEAAPSLKSFAPLTEICDRGNDQDRGTRRGDCADAR